MIDSHVHLRDGLLSQKETIEHGAGLAAAAGFTALFDMPNTDPPLVSEKRIMERFALAETSLKKINKDIFYGVYGGLTSDSKQIENSVLFYKTRFPAIVGFKMFAGHSTGKMGIVEKEEQRKVYSALSKLNYRGVLAVHCEKESLIKHSVFNIDKPITHSFARPPVSEAESVKEQIELVQSENFSGHLHICHVSTAAGIELVQTAKKNGMNISCGATAHHALLNMESYSRLGILVKINPPLRGEEDRLAVFNALISGSIDWIESDHAPHTLEDKRNGASGVPGFAGSLLLVQKLREAGCTETRLAQLCGKTVNKIFGLNLPFNVPSKEDIVKALPSLRKAYPFDVFSDISIK
ncbi:dihydroorotase family protein [Treponema pedis]|uniref:dihydroorotase family protein n=1 Tax=Treponema pedis TaxID=409322 RepID=UPI00040444C2|nr:dihydroorotase family protein [Treponema pedis]